MATQIQITLVKNETATHGEIIALLTKVYDFATSEGYTVKHQTSSIN